jgi:hypothetical protein
MLCETNIGIELFVYACPIMAPEIYGTLRKYRNPRKILMDLGLLFVQVQKKILF